MPFAQPEASDLAALLRRNLQLNEPAVGDQVEEDSKMPSLPRVTTFTSPAAAQEAVHTFLERWNLETPAGRAALQEQGQEILKGVEALKKECKQSYRHQVLGFETKDVDPLVWERVLQEQEATKGQLNAVRGLRAQLLDTCQVRGEKLEEAGIRTTFDEDKQEEVLYSSDEEDQAVSDMEMAPKTHRAFVAGVGQALQGQAEGLLKTLIDPLGTIESYVQLIQAIPDLPEILGVYIEEFLEEADEEKRAEMLGSLLTEAVLLVAPSPKERIAAGISKKLGKAAQRVAKGGKQMAPRSINQLDTLVKKGKAPKGILRFDQKKLDPHTLVEHVHFKDGSALNKNGSWRHGGKKLTNEEIKFLKHHGWTIPE